MFSSIFYCGNACALARSPPHSCWCHTVKRRKQRHTRSLQRRLVSDLSSATGWKRVWPGESGALRRAGESSFQGGGLSCDGVKGLGYSDEAIYIGHREGKDIRPIKSCLRVHRTCVGAGGSLSLVVREVKNGVKVR